MQATKAKRGVSVMWSHTFSDGRQLCRVQYQDEAGKRDGYYVSRELDSLDVQWSHVSDLDRTYAVTCAAGGRAIACTCPARVECRHRLATTALIDAGHLDNGPTQGEYPEGWGWDEDAADAERDYERLAEIGFARVSQYRD